MRHVLEDLLDQSSLSWLWRQMPLNSEKTALLQS